MMAIRPLARRMRPFRTRPRRVRPPYPVADATVVASARIRQGVADSAGTWVMCKDARIVWTGEFACPGSEREFRQAQARQEVSQMRLIWAFALACFFVYVPADLVVAESVGAAMLGLRLAIIAVGLLVLLVLQSPTGRHHRDLVASMALLTAMCCYGAMIGLRPGTSTGALLLLLAGSYLFSPARFVLHLATGILGSFAAVGLALAVGGAEKLDWLEFSYLAPANLLAAIALAQINRSRRRLYRQGLELRREIDRRLAAQARLAAVNRRNLRLLYNTLPRDIARQLQANPASPPARELASVAVLFADIVEFSRLAARLPARELVQLLNALFSSFDQLSRRCGVEKIKTVGDAYLAVAGLDGHEGASARAAQMALWQLAEARRVGAQLGVPVKLRIGLHAGPVVAGVLGRHRYAFDVWGDSVNIASRLQLAAPVDGILVSTVAREGCPDWMRFGHEREIRLRGRGRIRACVLKETSAAAELTRD